MYVNDLPNALPHGVFCSMYADDSKIFSVNDCALLQQGIDALANWSETWGLEISKEKTFVMCFGRNHPIAEFSLHSNTLVKANKCLTLVSLTQTIFVLKII